MPGAIWIGTVRDSWSYSFSYYFQFMQKTDLDNFLLNGSPSHHCSKFPPPLEYSPASCPRLAGRQLCMLRRRAQDCTAADILKSYDWIMPVEMLQFAFGYTIACITGGPLLKALLNRHLNSQHLMNVRAPPAPPAQTEATSTTYSALPQWHNATIEKRLRASMSDDGKLFRAAISVFGPGAKQVRIAQKKDAHDAELMKKEEDKASKAKLVTQDVDA